MSNQKTSKATLIKKDLELIKQEEAEFFQRLVNEVAILAQEGIGFYLPKVVIDHIADTETNLSFIKSRVKSCAKEGVDEGDGLQLFKVRRVQVRYCNLIFLLLKFFLVYDSIPFHLRPLEFNLQRLSLVFKTTYLNWRALNHRMFIYFLILMYTLNLFLLNLVLQCN